MKSDIKRVALILAVVGLISLVAGGILLGHSAGSVIGSDSQINDDRSYSVANLAEFTIKTVSTDIQWYEGAGNEVRVHLHGRVVGTPPELVVHEGESSLKVEIKHRPSVGFFNSEQLVLDIYVPKGLQFTQLTAETVSGDVTLKDIGTSHLKIKSVSGDVDVANVSTEQATLDNTSGDFDIFDFTGSLDYNSVSGDLELAYLDTPETIRAESVSGDISLDLPDDAEFNLKANTVSGDITCKFPLLVTGKLGDRGISGTVGDGWGTIELKTVSGDQRLL